MRIVMLSDYETSWGAAIAASRLATGLLRENVEVIRIVGNASPGSHPWTTRTLKPASPGGVLTNSLAKASKRLARSVESHLVGRRLHELLTDVQPDVINVHNLHGASWGPELVDLCAQFSPTVWTLHDMWSFTGRCAYSYDCRKFMDGCDSTCPTPNEYPELEPKLIASAWDRRRELFARHSDLVGVCPSRWLAQEALKGMWAGHRIERIPSGLQLDIYEPVEKRVARAALGIEGSRPVLLAAVQNPLERRKGGQILIETIKRMTTRPVTVVTLGRGRLPLESDGIHMFPLGYVSERAKVLAFSAADLLVHPAPVDNLPSMVMEAIACGTPVAGFSVGGIPELIRSGRTGWLAEEVSSSELAITIDSAIREIRAGVDYTSSCRTTAESEYGLELQAHRYSSLFQSLGS